MRVKHLGNLRFAFVITALVGTIRHADAGPIRPSPRYTVTDVGHLPTGELFIPTGLNDRGDLVGPSGRGNLVLSPDGSMRNVVGNYNDKINNAGQTLIDDSDHALNNRGDSVGRDTGTIDDSNRATLRPAGGEKEFLLPSWATASRAYGINDKGQVVGETREEDGSWHAFLYEDGVYTNLRPQSPLATSSVARAINNLGEIVVNQIFDGGAAEAYALIDGEFQSIGLLPNAISHASVAADINDLGQIIGFASSDQGNHAFLYEDGELFDLNELIPPTTGWTLTGAVDINNSGQILVKAQRGDETTRMLLTPVPEPSTLAMLAAGALLLVVRHRKVNRRQA